MTGYKSKRAAAQDKLAQPEQEPMPNKLERLLWEYIDLQAAHPEHKPNHKTWSHLKVYAPLPAQEPVAWLEPEWGEKICPEVGYEVTMTDDHPRDLCWIPLYAQRPWVDLTPQNLNEIFAIARTGEHAVRLALDKLKEKNNAA